MKLNENIKQLRELISRPSQLQIAVYGKYNHGKSSLLNALVKKDIFKTADIRETVKIQSYTNRDITWIDTPGLDADVKESDDTEANRLLSTSDLLLFVHSVNEGELDSKEVLFLKEQSKNSKNIILVLTQIDRTETLNSLKTVIKKQFTSMSKPIEIIAVSSKRASHNNLKIRKKSNIDILLEMIEKNKNKMLNKREQEKSNLKREIQKDVDIKLSKLNQSKAELSQELSILKNEFLEDVDNVREYKLAYKEQ
jgi:small GTP-binding protein